MRRARISLIFLVVFIDLLGFGIMIPMLPFYAESMGAGSIQIGLLMASYSFFQIFAGPIWGAWSDRIGRRPVLLMTIIGQSLAFALSAIAPDFWFLLLSRSLAGLFGGNISVASAYMADITSEEERGKAMGLIGAAFGLGFVFGPAIGGLLISYGPAWPSVVAAALAFINALGAYFYLAEPPVDTQERSKNRKQWSKNDLKDFLGRIEIVIPTLIFFFFTFAFVQLEVTFGLFVTNIFGFSQKDSGLMLALVGVTMAIVQGGLLGKAIRVFGELNLVLLGSLTLCMGLVALSLAQTNFWLLSSLLILGVGYSLANPCLTSLVSKAAPSNRRGSVMGFYQSVGSIARIVAPVTAGAVYHLDPRYPMKLGAIMVAGAAAIWTVRALVARAEKSS